MITQEQFDALTKLKRGKPDSPACKAARQVLLEGISPTQAARNIGITRGTVHKAVLSYTEAHELIKSVY